jgi:hypothetical protein
MDSSAITRRYFRRPMPSSNFDRDVVLSCGFVGVLLALFTLWHLGFL